MILGDYLVIALTVLNLCSAFAYGMMGDTVRMIYWLGAFLLTGSTIFMGR